MEGLSNKARVYLLVTIFLGCILILWSLARLDLGDIWKLLVLSGLTSITLNLKVPGLERKTEIDPKTGLNKAEYFLTCLSAELERANRFERPHTIVMADMELLRNINNAYGHLVGDEVLIRVANIFKQSVREFDVVARFGGDEYAVLMPETTPQEAFPQIDEIRNKIENAEFSVQTSVIPIKATMSFGIAGRECAV